MKKLLILIGLLVVSATRAEVYIDDKKVDLDVVDLYLKTSSAWGCPAPKFHHNDENKDGKLDDICVGLEYDPCNMEGSVWWAYVNRAEVCQTKKEVAADCAVDFSPLPPKCNTGTPRGKPSYCKDVDFSPLPPECRG